MLTRENWRELWEMVKAWGLLLFLIMIFWTALDSYEAYTKNVLFREFADNLLIGLSCYLGLLVLLAVVKFIVLLADQRKDARAQRA